MLASNHVMALKAVLLRVSFGALLVLLCIRDYLFGNGLFVYRDWTWPLSNRVAPVASFSPKIITTVGPDALGFARMFMTWPVLIMQALTDSPVLAEKAYVLYLFSVMIFLFFVLAELLLQLFVRESKKTISNGSRSAFVLMAVLLCVVNFWSLQQLSDLYFPYMIEFALMGISITLVLLKSSFRQRVLLPGALLSICIFLDPNLYPFLLAAVVITILSQSIRKNASHWGLLKGLLQTGTLFLTTLPALLTMLYVFYISTGTNLRPPGTYEISSVNLSLSNSLRLFGYWWSLIAYAPPNVLWTNSPVSSTSSIGTPSYLLLPSGPLTGLWLLSTFFVPTFAFGAAVASRLRSITVPVSICAVFGLLLTQPRIFPFPYLLATELKDTPLIGGALVTFLAIPDHALVLVAISYTVLTSLGVFSILTMKDGWRIGESLRALLHAKPSRTPNLRIGRTLGVFIIVILLMFQGWQFLSGSFYPSGYIWNGTGNGLSNIGTFTPSSPPPEMYHVYDWLLSQSGNFNVYWPGASGASYPWSEKATGALAYFNSPRPTLYPPALPYLLQSNLTGDISDYLSALNIRYLVVQPFDKVAMEYSWGVSDPFNLNEILEKTPGISFLFSDGEISVYEVDGSWGSVYSAPLLASHNSTDLEYAIAYHVLASLGTKIALVDASSLAQSLCFDDLYCPIDVLSPQYLGFQGSTATSIVTLNESNSTLPTTLLQGFNSSPLPSPWDHWLLNNWGSGDSEVGITAGSLRLSFGGTPTVLTLSYNGTVTGGHPGGINLPLGQQGAVHTGFWYRTSDSFDGSVRIVIPQLDRSSAYINDISSPYLPVSPSWKYGTFNSTLAPGTAYFTSRFQAEGRSGWIQFRNVTIGYDLFQESGNSPFGTIVSTASRDLVLSEVRGYPSVQFQGTGSLIVAGQTLPLTSSDRPTWISLPSLMRSDLTFSGALNISAIIIANTPLAQVSIDSAQLGTGENPQIKIQGSTNVVYPEAFAHGYTLGSSAAAFQARATIDGISMFTNVGPGTYSVSFPQIGIAFDAYLVALAFIFGLISLTIFGRFPERLLRNMRALKLRIKESREPAKDPSEG